MGGIISCRAKFFALIDIITNCQVKLHEPGFAGLKLWQDLLFDNG
jgi:hypothetical protein